MVILVLPLFALEITGSYASASLAMAMFGPGTLLADIPAGMLISRLGVRPVMLLGILLMASAAFIAALAGPAYYLGIAVFVLGMGRGFVMLSRMAYITEIAQGKIGQAMSAVGGAMRVGVFLGPIVAGFIAKYFGFTPALMIAGLVIGSTILFIGFLSGVSRPTAAEHGNNPFKSVKSVLIKYKKVFLTAGTAVIGLTVIRSVRLIIIPLWGDSIGLDEAQIGLIAGVPMGLEMFMFYPVGLIMDRYGRKWVSVPCLGIFSFALALIPFCSSFTALMAVVLVMGFGNGLGSGIFLTLGADFSPSEGRGEFLGVWRLFGDTGSTTGPFLISVIMEALTLTFATLTAAAIGLAGALIMLFFVKESRAKQPFG